MSYIIKTIGDKVTLSLLLTKKGAGVTGLSPTVEVRRNADDLYLDFSAVSPPYWVSTGGQREKILTEQSWLGGYYTWLFDQSVYEAGGAIGEYTIIYRHDAPFKLLASEVIAFDDIPLTILKYLRNYQELEKLSATHFTHKVFEDDKVTLMQEVDITQVGDKEIRDPV